MPYIFKIRELRKASGLTQKQLADALGIRSASTICAWESGATVPDSTVLPTLAKVLNCSLDQLYQKKGENGMCRDYSEEQLSDAAAMIDLLDQTPDNKRMLATLVGESFLNGMAAQKQVQQMAGRGVSL